MFISTQKLTPLSFNRKADKQIAIDHLVKASSSVNKILEVIEGNENISLVEMDIEISPKWAILLREGRVFIEQWINTIEDDDLVRTLIPREGTTLIKELEERVLPSLIEEVKDYRHEREEYANENDGY